LEGKHPVNKPDGAILNVPPVFPSNFSTQTQEQNAANGFTAKFGGISGRSPTTKYIKKG
jgi:hypothetical protein